MFFLHNTDPSGHIGLFFWIWEEHQSTGCIKIPWIHSLCMIGNISTSQMLAPTLISLSLPI